jgi:hypothetical protein
MLPWSSEPKQPGWNRTAIPVLIKATTLGDTEPSDEGGEGAVVRAVGIACKAVGYSQAAALPRLAVAVAKLNKKARSSPTKRHALLGLNPCEQTSKASKGQHGETPASKASKRAKSFDTPLCSLCSHTFFPVESQPTGALLVARLPGTHYLTIDRLREIR